MEQFGVGNVSFRSLDPKQDEFAYWLWCLGFWNTKIVESIEKAGSVLPTDLADRFRKLHNLPFEEQTKNVFLFLLNDMNGLAISKSVIRQRPWTDPKHPYGRLHRLSLVRIDDYLLKPKKIAFDSRVQCLVGISN